MGGRKSSCQGPQISALHPTSSVEQPSKISENSELIKGIHNTCCQIILSLRAVLEDRDHCINRNKLPYARFSSQPQKTTEAQLNGIVVWLKFFSRLNFLHRNSFSLWLSQPRPCYLIKHLRSKFTLADFLGTHCSVRKGLQYMVQCFNSLK